MYKIQRILFCNSNNISDKDIVYHFMCLSFIERSTLLEKHYLVKNNREGKKHIDILDEILSEVTKRNIRQLFWEDITNTEKGKDNHGK